MKKLIGTVAALLLVAGAAFAEIGISAWNKAIFAPVEYDGDDVTSSIHAPWGGEGRVTGLSFGATSEDGKAGIATDLRYTSTSGGPTGGDTYVMWIKPIDMLRVSFGKWDYTDFKTGVCLPSWDWLRPSNYLADDDCIAFGQIGDQAGVQLLLEPIENLTIMWNLPVSNESEAYKMFEKQHIGVIYNIEGIGKIKVGFAGNGGRHYEYTAADFAAATSYPDDYYEVKNKAVVLKEGNGDEYKYLGNIKAAFELTAVENLLVTIGADIAIASSDYKDYASMGSATWKKKASVTGDISTMSDVELDGFSDFRNVLIGLGASYQVTDEFAVMMNGAVALYNKADPAFQIGVGLTYAISDALTAAADFRFLKTGGYKNTDLKVDYDPDPAMSFMVGVNYQPCSNGTIGIGFQGVMKHATPTWCTAREDFVFAVPIQMQLSF